MSHRHFTLESAQRMIPPLTERIDRLRRLQEAIEFLEDTNIELDEEEMDEEEFQEMEDAEFPEDLKAQKEYHRLNYLFYKELEALEKSGCILKDLDEGLVEFIHIFEERHVFLCWKYGEDKIRHWHEVEDGAAGRQPILDLADSISPQPHRTKPWSTAKPRARTQNGN